jgi:hypothetical protein
MRQVCGDHAARICERQLRLRESDAVLKLIFAILGGIPIESRRHLWDILHAIHIVSHIEVWLLRQGMTALAWNKVQ